MNIDERLENDPGTELGTTALTDALQPHARALVQQIDPVTADNTAKHDWVYSVLLALVPLLQGAVKETRAIPADVIATAVDDVLEAAVSWLRSL